MKIRIVVDEKKVFEYEDHQIKNGEMPAIFSRSFEGYSYFAVRYVVEEDTLEIYYGAEWTRLAVNLQEEEILF